jgi:hypothetical protein
VEEAVAGGARVLLGGAADGTCYQATIVTDVPAGTELAESETFGPVVAIEIVDDGRICDRTRQLGGSAAMDEFTELGWVTFQSGSHPSRSEPISVAPGPVSSLWRGLRGLPRLAH